MYQDDYFYGLTDIMHYNVYAILLKDKIIKEERVIIKVFKKDNEVVVIETNNFKDIVLKDTRKDKNSDLMTYDLVYLHSLERYYSDYEIPGMIYEYVEGLGSWYRVKIDGFKPLDKDLKPFYLKKKLSRKDLVKYAKDEDTLIKLNKFYDVTKGLIKFSKPKKVKELLEGIENSN